MKIVVCVKQVPDTKGGVKFNPDGTLDRGAMLAIMNFMSIITSFRVSHLAKQPRIISIQIF